MNATPQTRDDRIRDFDFELDQMLLELVLNRHPEWRQSDGSCPTCWVEVERMRERADRVELVDA